MNPRIDLVWLGGALAPPSWEVGELRYIDDSAAAVNAIVTRYSAESIADAWLFWDSRIPPPDVGLLERLLSKPGDIWHAGLALGQRGKPEIADFVIPTWTLSRDPDSGVEAMSWRSSFRACLVRTEVLRWGGPRADFSSLDGAALEWAHRCVMYGAMPRSCTDLIPRTSTLQRDALPLSDEFRFARLRFGTLWAAWAAWRALATGYASLEAIGDAWLASRGSRCESPPQPFISKPSLARSAPPSISVLIPTLHRYPYLRTVLGQLRSQTVAAREIIVIDQTPKELRDQTIGAEFADLPLVLITLDEAGQSTARNAGLVRAVGDAVLFLDDDDEIEEDLIARHLDHIAATGAEVSSGVAREPGSSRLPEEFTRIRASDVFPTNNTLALRTALERSGLFDVAFDHGARADGDLGMRIYLAGAVMWLAPSISVFHHHAPRGGLRTHRARVITYESSRRRVTQRHVPDVTELYRAMRYFSAAQLREMIIQAALGTLSAHGGAFRRALKLAYGLAMMPLTLLELRRRLNAARAMLASFPQIPPLPPRFR